MLVFHVDCSIASVMLVDFWTSFLTAPKLPESLLQPIKPSTAQPAIVDAVPTTGKNGGKGKSTGRKGSPKKGRAGSSPSPTRKNGKKKKK